MNVSNIQQAPIEAPRTRRMTMAKVTKGPQLRPPRCAVYGPPGIGKSTFASGAPEPIWIPFDDGTQHLDIQRFPRPESLQDVQDALDELLTSEHDRKTVVLDGLAELEALIWRHVCAVNNWANIEEPGFGKGYTAAMDWWRDIFAMLARLHSRKEMGIILIGHSRVRTFSSPEVESYDRYQFQLNDNAAALIQREMDYILFAREAVYLDKGTDKRVRGRNSGNRVIETQGRAAYDAKSRPSLPTPLPLSYQAFAEARVKFDPAHRAANVVELKAQIAAALAELGDAASTEKTNAHVEKLAVDAVERHEEVLNKVQIKIQQKKAKEQGQ